jgi:hypothetical protein
MKPIGQGLMTHILSIAYPTKEAVDDAIAYGSTSGAGESFEQLDELLVALRVVPRQLLKLVGLCARKHNEIIE